jgi:signal transduction histidine kinase
VIGLVLANARLIEDLRTSRQRLVTAQDEARRRLERNLHDGAQQDLVALSIKAQLADVTIDEDPAHAKQLLGEIKADAAGALENLRDLARGIYRRCWPTWARAAALNAQAAKSPLLATVEVDGIGRFGQDTEAAAYFCCLEALQNTAKYAHATQAASACRRRTGRCASPSPTMGQAMTPGTSRWARACGTWPTGSPPSAASSKSGPLPPTAPPSPGTSPPSHHQRR